MEELQRLTAMIMAARIGLLISGLVLIVIGARLTWDRWLG